MVDLCSTTFHHNICSNIGRFTEINDDTSKTSITPPLRMLVQRYQDKILAEAEPVSALTTEDLLCEDRDFFA